MDFQDSWTGGKSMSALSFFIIFMLFFALVYAAKIVLNRLNYSYLGKKSGQIPDELKETVDAEKLKQIDAYSRDKLNLGMAIIIFDCVVMAIFLLSPFFQIYTDFIESFELSFMYKGIAFFLISSVVAFILTLPFDWYSNFRIEEKYGFNKLSLGKWISDKVKSLLLASVVLCCFSAVFLSLLTEEYAFSWSKTFELMLWNLLPLAAIAVLAPLVIAPLIMKLKPLSDNDGLKEEIYALAKKAGVQISRIKLIDQQKETTHANAGIMGIGKAKTLMLSSNLLEKYSREEILAVVAHEFGHVKKKHIWRRLFVILLGFSVFCFIALLMMSWPELYKMFLTEHVLYAELMLLTLFFTWIMYFMKSVFNHFERKDEYEADRFAAELVESAQPLISVFSKAAVNELAQINPHPWFSRQYYSHATMAERIAALKQNLFCKGRGNPSSVLCEG